MSESRPNHWSVTVGPTSLPSPAPTHVSEKQSKKNCVSNDWTSLISYDEQSPLEFSNCEEQLLNLEMSQSAAFSNADDMSYILQTGLPTPSMSPPQMRYLSSSDLETVSSTSPPNMPPLSQGVSVRGSQTMATRRAEALPEDDETVCIKLLAHLKRFSQQQQSYESVLSLVQKTNAALRRLLRSRTIRTNYSCHLLLTNIVLHLASFSERLIPVPPQQQHPQPENEFVHESYLIDGDSDLCNIQRRQNGIWQDMRPLTKNAVTESIMINAGVGDLLKRKPLDGFQVLGRQESAHIEIDSQLRGVLASLS
ncbi:hypothetical protein H2198_003162 [Neophaeococcomyces mojaviensis]|uniref:Uncharacterized protein n=1 Tax=Neophaeococcomyces mojaviensis TaxID=3383035 RepID=A0ACC3ACD7_9EURO|nr:hypothetical protein H2198_003162 [Knufia sp. JES_112]